MNGLTADFRRYVARVLERFQVPGAAISVVKDGRTVLQEGYGVRKMGAPEPVDSSTLSGIASNTKAFTAVALGMLIDDGRLSWETPVIDVLPAFQMHDPYVTREMTVLDLLVHRSGLGLGAGDLLFWPAPTTFTRTDFVTRLRHLKPASSFRSAYAYDNVLYVVAGEVVAAAAGMSWDAFLSERIFTPLQMHATSTSITAIPGGANVITPHGMVDGHIQPIGMLNMDNAAAAGGINSNVADMGRWMAVLLNGGVMESGERLYSEKTAHALWIPRTLMPNEPSPRIPTECRPHFVTYALGFAVSDYRGRLTVEHAGGLPGMVSHVLLAPSEKLGITVLTNQESGPAKLALRMHLLDAFLGTTGTDWIEVGTGLVEDWNAAESAAEQKHTAARNVDSYPSLPASGYAGRYTDPWYGDITVREEAGSLTLQFERTPRLCGTLNHWHYDTFVVRWQDRTLNADAFVTFTINAAGAVTYMSIEPVSPNTDFSFDFKDLSPVKSG